jgi:hypothetical protein
MKARNQQQRRRSLNSSKPDVAVTTVLNGYELQFPADFSVPVNTYIVQHVGDESQTDEDRGEIVSVAWDYWRQNKHHCDGRNYFVVDLEADRIAVPSGWQLPACEDFKGFSISPDAYFVAKLDDAEHHGLILKLIQQSVKRHFQDNNYCEPLGPLWKSFGDFCQMPSRKSRGDFCFCRRFIVTPVVVGGDRFALRISIRTVCLDARTLDYYYREGKVAELAEMIEAKQSSGSDRKGNAFGVHVWLDESTEHMTNAKQLELVDPAGIVATAKRSPIEQRRLAGTAVLCAEFKKPPAEVSLAKLRLVVNTDITSEQHRETIISPSERWRLQNDVRNYLQNLTVVGKTARLAAAPLSTDSFACIDIRPPVVRVLNEWQQPVELDTPSEFSFEALEERAKNRMRAVERNGFLRSLDINPALAWHVSFPARRAQRMQRDLNHILNSRNIKYQFGLLRFKNVEDLRKQLADAGHDAVLVVLPEHSSQSGRPNDTHEQLKKRLEIPSKCIHHDNTLAEHLAAIRVRDLDEAGKREFNQTKQKYRLTLDHLLIKHGWIPFEPAEPFHFNVHVGLDVGGRRNDTVVACLGYGFGAADQGLTFFTQQIHVEKGKAEPIPTDSLLTGLLQLFEHVYAEAKNVGVALDFDSVLCIRDGAMLGAGDEWNEREALTKLRERLVSDGLATSAARWAVAEIHKRAEEWRLFDKAVDAIRNPLVGRCIYDFQRPNEGLLTTTGRPYLFQGTAQVLKVVTSSISGNCTFQEIIQDVSWEADMGFTRPDMGRGLPWVLHGADCGALHASKGYRLIGLMG